MFGDMPGPLRDRMRHLEATDARDRLDGTPRSRRLRQVPPETGRFLALLAATAPEGRLLELGTSAGYSTLWLALAARARGRCVTTFEVDPEKVRLARATFREAQVEDAVELVSGDALELLERHGGLGFCFLDLEKEQYGACYEAVIPRLVPGGLLVADNAINHAAVLQPLIDRALQDPRVDALVVPIGKGELVCRKKP